MKRIFNTFYNEDPPDDDAENFGAFMNYFGRATKDPKWLDHVKSSISSGAAAVTEAPKELAGYLQKQLDKTETQLAEKSALVEKMRDLLSPEQLTSLRSAPSAVKGDPGSLSPSDGPPQKPAPPPAPPPKKKSKWLGG